MRGRGRGGEGKDEGREGGRGVKERGREGEREAGREGRRERDIKVHYNHIIYVCTVDTFTQSLLSTEPITCQNGALW